MLICGLKLTHDGGLALIEDGRLLTSVEMEKLHNNKRFQPLDRLEMAEEVLSREGVRTDDIDLFVIDGWFPRLRQDPQRPTLRVTHHGRAVELPSPLTTRSLMRRYWFVTPTPACRGPTPRDRHTPATTTVLSI